MVEVDEEEVVKESPSLVRKNSKKSDISKGKGQVSEKVILSENDDEVEKEK